MGNVAFSAIRVAEVPSRPAHGRPRGPWCGAPQPTLAGMPFAPVRHMLTHAVAALLMLHGLVHALGALKPVGPSGAAVGRP